MDRVNRVPFGMKGNRLTRVEDVPNGLPCGCTCPSCDVLLIAVNNPGIKVAPHFRHSNPLSVCEGYIHETAKVGLAGMLNEAIESGQAVPLIGQFRDCGHTFKTSNILNGITKVSVERKIREPNIRPDIVLEENNAPAKTIEVVDKHPPEEAVIEFARQNSCPLAIIEVHTEDELQALLSGFPIEGAKVIVPVDCPTCESGRRRREEEATRLRKLEQEAQRRREAALQLVSRTVKPSNNATSLRQVENDKYGANLKAHTRLSIMANARRLQALGFEQKSKRASLLQVALPGWTVFADLDSTEVMRIWEAGCVPALYAFPKGNGSVICRECILEAVGRRLDSYGIEFRRHFEGTEGHICYKPQLR